MSQQPSHDDALTCAGYGKGAPLSRSVPLRCESPVFILTASRSGSTLLRIILDSHPRLACPPETAITSACLQLAMTCDVLENAGASSSAADDSGLLASAITDTVRAAVDRAFGSYLVRRGKQRWCDKSLDSYLHADLMAQVYPEARFICLFRHCMDVIASGVEACPWGLQRYGYDPFVAQYPGNSVAAIGSYWLACAQAILSFADQHPGSCHQVRYEDLVTAPEETVARILSFLGEQQVPGITQTCFDTPHEASGPADEKLWFTTAVSTDSMGRGTVVPANALPEPVRGPVNQVLDRLGYRPVDEHWNDGSMGTDPRLTKPPGPAPAPFSAGGPGGASVESAAALITDLLRSQPSDKLREITGYWPELAGQTVEIVVDDGIRRSAGLRQTFPVASAEDAAYADGSGYPTVRSPNPEADADAVAATITASPATWQSLLDGRANMVTELSAGRIRSVGGPEDHGHAGCIQGHHPTRAIRAIAALLGISKIPIRALAASSARAPD